MGLTAAECDKMVKAAEKAGKQMLVGHVPAVLAGICLRAEGDRQRQVRQAAGRALQAGHFRSAAGSRTSSIPAKVGGPLVDLHVHDAHFIRLLFGMPTAVTSQGRLRGDVVEYCVSQFQFADPARWSSSSASGVVNQQGRSFTHGFEIHLEKATLYFDLAVLAGGKLQVTPLTLLDGKGKAEQPKLPAGDPMLTAFEAEIKEVVRSIASDQPSALLVRQSGPRRDRALPQADAGRAERQDR